MIVPANVPSWLAFYFLALFSAIFILGFTGVAAWAVGFFLIFEFKEVKLQSICLHQFLSAISDLSFKI